MTSFKPGIVGVRKSGGKKMMDTVIGIAFDFGKKTGICFSCKGGKGGKVSGKKRGFHSPVKERFKPLLI